MKQHQAGQGNKNMRICVPNSVNVPLRACRLGRPVPRLSGQGSFVSGQCSDKPLELGSCRPILSHKQLFPPGYPAIVNVALAIDPSQTAGL